MAEKMMIFATHGPEDTERATIPFVMATAAQASDVEVIIGFQSTGVLLATQGVIEHILAPGFPPLKDLYDAFVEAGGKMYVCGPCIKSRNINPETDLVKGATVVSAATFVKEISESVGTLVY